MPVKSPWKRLIRAVSVLFFVFFPDTSYSLTAGLAWDPSEGADYYVVYWGTESRVQTGTYEFESGPVADTTYTFEDPDLPDETLLFAVRAFNAYGGSPFSDEVCILSPSSVAPDYDKGWGVTIGPLEGFMIHYPATYSPSLGPVEGIPSLQGFLDGQDAVGLPLNVQPSGISVSPYNVKVFVPCPGYSDVSLLDIYLYDDANAQWFLAHRSDDPPDVIQPTAVGWLVENSRINHNETTPPTIEVQLYRLSGVQAAATTPLGVAVSILRLMTGGELPISHRIMDMNGNGKIELADAIHALQNAAGLR